MDESDLPRGFRPMDRANSEAGPFHSRLDRARLLSKKRDRPGGGGLEPPPFERDRGFDASSWAGPPGFKRPRPDFGEPPPPPREYDRSQGRGGGMPRPVYGIRNDRPPPLPPRRGPSGTFGPPPPVDRPPLDRLPDRKVERSRGGYAAGHPAEGRVPYGGRTPAYPPPPERDMRDRPDAPQPPAWDSYRSDRSSALPPPPPRAGANRMSAVGNHHGSHLDVEEGEYPDVPHTRDDKGGSSHGDSHSKEAHSKEGRSREDRGRSKDELGPSSRHRSDHGRHRSDHTDQDHTSSARHTSSPSRTTPASVSSGKTDSKRDARTRADAESKSPGRAANGERTGEPASTPLSDEQPQRKRLTWGMSLARLKSIDPRTGELGASDTPAAAVRPSEDAGTGTGLAPKAKALYTCPQEAPSFQANQARHRQLASVLQRLVQQRRDAVQLRECELALQYRTHLEFWKQQMQGKKGAARANGNGLALGPAFARQGSRKGMMGTARSDYEEMQIVSQLQAIDRMKTMVQIPPLILDARERDQRRFITTNCRVPDPVAVLKEEAASRPWSTEEKRIFMDRFLQFPKDFRKIADGLPHRSVGDCIVLYYKIQKLDEFAAVRRKQQLKKRRLQSEVNRNYNYLGMASTAAAKRGEGPVRGNASRAAGAYPEPPSRAGRAARGRGMPNARPGRGAGRGRGTGPAELMGENGPGLVPGAAMLPGEDVPSTWSDLDETLFLDAVRACGKDMKAISRHMGTKTAAAVKSFYYKHRRRLALDQILEERMTLQSPEQLDDEAGMGMPMGSGVDPSPPSGRVTPRGGSPEMDEAALQATESLQETPGEQPGLAIAANLLSAALTGDPGGPRELDPGGGDLTANFPPQLQAMRDSMLQQLQEQQEGQRAQFAQGILPALAAQLVAAQHGQPMLPHMGLNPAMLHQQMPQLAALAQLQAALGLPMHQVIQILIQQQMGGHMGGAHLAGLAGMQAGMMGRFGALPGMPGLPHLGGLPFGGLPGGPLGNPPLFQNFVAGNGNPGTSMGMPSEHDLWRHHQQQQQQSLSYWSHDEKDTFMQTYKTYGRDWDRLQRAVPTKTITQIKNYYQNYKTKLGLDRMVLPPGAVGPGSRKRKIDSDSPAGGTPSATPPLQQQPSHSGSDTSPTATPPPAHSQALVGEAVAALHASERLGQERFSPGPASDALLALQQQVASMAALAAPGVSHPQHTAPGTAGGSRPTTPSGGLEPSEFAAPPFPGLHTSVPLLDGTKQAATPPSGASPCLHASASSERLGMHASTDPAAQGLTPYEVAMAAARSRSTHQRGMPPSAAASGGRPAGELQSQPPLSASEHLPTLMAGMSPQDAAQLAAIMGLAAPTPSPQPHEAWALQQRLPQREPANIAAILLQNPALLAQLPGTGPIIIIVFIVDPSHCCTK
ncbi:hypothetical protein WJX72_006161 [[Myrmecia] bisecta]|uniref:Uncharacterized protein n=1 Tax=[Myrmecia] bisecta TaxID=41462 RepID=A0AAW1Q409_9CHLO